MGCTDWKVIKTGKGREKKTLKSLENKAGVENFTTLASLGLYGRSYMTLLLF